MDANGVVWTITNAPPATGKYITHFDLTTSNAWFEAENTNVATFAQGATADLALPKSSTNALAVTTLQITGGSPSNNAIMVTTGTAGQTTWKTLSKFRVYTTAAQNFSADWIKVTWGNTNFDIGNHFTANDWVPGRAGYVFVSAKITFVNVSDQHRYSMAIYRDGAAISVHDWASSGTLTIQPVDSVVDYCPGATNRYSVYVYTGNAETTWSDGSAYNVFEGFELP
jgi:hypothetical protein